MAERAVFIQACKPIVKTYLMKHMTTVEHADLRSIGEIFQTYNTAYGQQRYTALKFTATHHSSMEKEDSPPDVFSLLVQSRYGSALLWVSNLCSRLSAATVLVCWLCRLCLADR